MSSSFDTLSLSYNEKDEGSYSQYAGYRYSALSTLDMDEFFMDKNKHVALPWEDFM